MDEDLIKTVNRLQVSDKSGHAFLNEKGMRR